MAARRRRCAASRCSPTTTGRLGTDQERILQERAATQPLELISSLDELRERIALHLSADQPGDVLPLVRADEPAAAVSQDADGSLAGRTVLVVDDDDRNLYALTGHPGTARHAGAPGRERPRPRSTPSPRNPAIDLILMDVMMPEMDGYAATAAIRAMPDHAELPIIAVTAKAMIGDREKSLASGASDYVTKPVDAGELIARIKRQLARLTRPDRFRHVAP